MRYLIFMICAAAGFILSCESMDDMKDRYSRGEVAYAPKVDTFAIHGGNNRARADVRVGSNLLESVRVFWTDNNKVDSADIAVNYTPGEYSIMLNNVAENDYIFKATGFDRYKNSSLTYSVNGKVYGDRYLSLLSPRTIRLVDVKPAIQTIYWATAPEGLVGCEMEYKSRDGTTANLRVPQDVLSTALTDFAEDMRYRSLYLPTPDAIDTFYTEWRNVNLDGGAIAEIPKPVGRWEFDDADFKKATIGNDLIQIGSITQVAGNGNSKAVRIPQRSHFRLNHGIPAPLGRVYDYTLMFDVKVTVTGRYYCFMQTNLNNNDDGDVFIRPNGNVGIGSGLGYSDQVVPYNQWIRVIFSFKRGTWTRVYVEGEAFRDNNTTDDKFFLDPAGVLIFADEDGEDNEIDVDEVILWDRALTPDEVAALGIAGLPVVYKE